MASIVRGALDCDCDNKTASSSKVLCSGRDKFKLLSRQIACFVFQPCFWGWKPPPKGPTTQQSGSIAALQAIGDGGAFVGHWKWQLLVLLIKFIPLGIKCAQTNIPRMLQQTLTVRSVYRPGRHLIAGKGEGKCRLQGGFIWLHKHNIVVFARVQSIARINQAKSMWLKWH